MDKANSKQTSDNKALHIGSVSNSFLIAQFMGYTKASDLGYKNLPNRLHKDGFGIDVRTLQYATNWEYLMPVIEQIVSKIRVDKTNVYFRTFGMQNEDTKEYMVRIDRFPLFQAKTLIEATYLAVVNFIEYWFSKCNATEEYKKTECDGNCPDCDFHY